MIRYYFFVATQDFLLHQEPIEEILRERISHYRNLQKNIDFCITSNLSFLNTPELEFVKKQLVKPGVAIISLNPRFIDWLKLRVTYGIKGTFCSISPLNMTNTLVSSE